MTKTESTYYFESNIPLKEGIAHIRLPYPMSDKSFTLLIKILKTWKKGLVKEVVKP